MSIIAYAFLRTYPNTVEIGHVAALHKTAPPILRGNPMLTCPIFSDFVGLATRQKYPNSDGVFWPDTTPDAVVRKGWA